eukprot:1179840-Prorocentrum_minimum.AAC.2
MPLGYSRVLDQTTRKARVSLLRSTFRGNRVEVRDGAGGGGEVALDSLQRTLSTDGSVLGCGGALTVLAAKQYITITATELLFEANQVKRPEKELTVEEKEFAVEGKEFAAGVKECAVEGKECTAGGGGDQMWDRCSTKRGRAVGSCSAGSVGVTCFYVAQQFPQDLQIRGCYSRCRAALSLREGGPGRGGRQGTSPPAGQLGGPASRGLFCPKLSAFCA